MFHNRLEKVFRHLKKGAARQGISCYRVYDHDLPEFPFILELYGDKLYVAEYKRRHALSEEAHEAWLHECLEVVRAVLGVQPENIFLKMRQRKESRQGQYQKFDEAGNEWIVEEGGLKFIVNLSDYLDTGLFLDHRITRGMVRDISAGKRMLNLFCYTGSFSVYAGAGGASEVVSVDLSRTYLHWTERNMILNHPGFTGHRTVHADVKEFLKGEGEERYEIIVMDPPTFSNSKRMEDFLDIQRDHPALINECLRILSPGGVLFFSTNFTRFSLRGEAIKGGSVKDITKATTPFDFPRLNRPCFRITK